MPSRLARGTRHSGSASPGRASSTSDSVARALSERQPQRRRRCVHGKVSGHVRRPFSHVEVERIGVVRKEKCQMKRRERIMAVRGFSPEIDFTVSAEMRAGIGIEGDVHCSAAGGRDVLGIDRNARQRGAERRFHRFVGDAQDTIGNVQIGDRVGPRWRGGRACGCLGAGGGRAREYGCIEQAGELECSIGEATKIRLRCIGCDAREDERMSERIEFAERELDRLRGDERGSCRGARSPTGRGGQCP